MNIVLDSCSIINLLNGGLLNSISNLLNFKFYVGQHVFETEILNGSQKLILESLVKTGKILILESDVSLPKFTILKTKYRLGDGETECMALCKENNFTISTDDNKARKGSTIELGADMVIGTAFIIREFVRQTLIDCNTSLKVFQLMKDKGAFLPALTEKYLCG